MSGDEKRIYAEVIGDPIAHSKSPAIHRFWIEALGMDADYRAFHVKPDGLAAYIASRSEDAAWRGCNVTIPHKIAVLDHVADPGGIGESIGAANTVARGEDGTLFATNTDAAGFYASISGRDWAGAHVVLAGSGGAARAVLFALARMEVERVTMIARSPLKATGLLAHFGLKGDVVDFDAPLPPADLLVNASPLGMKGIEGEFRPDLSELPEDALVYDLVYAPLETPLLAAARARDLTCIDGLEMLIAQAAAAFEIFFGQAPPRGRDDELRALLTDAG